MKSVKVLHIMQQSKHLFYKKDSIFSRYFLLILYILLMARINMTIVNNPNKTNIFLKHTDFALFMIIKLLTNYVNEFWNNWSYHKTSPQRELMLKNVNVKTLAHHAFKWQKSNTILARNINRNFDWYQKNPSKVCHGKLSRIYT